MYDGMDGSASSQVVRGCDSQDANGWRKFGTGNPPLYTAMTTFRGGGGIDISAIMVGGGLLIP